MCSLIRPVNSQPARDVDGKGCENGKCAPENGECIKMQLINCICIAPVDEAACGLVVKFEAFRDCVVNAMWQHAHQGSAS